MAAAKGVKVVLGGRVVGLVRGLDSAFGHHRVGVAYAELCHKQNFGAGLAGHNRGACSGSASADNQNVGFVIDVVKVNLVRLHAGLGLKHFGQFNRGLLSLVGADLKFHKLLLDAVRVELQKKVVLFFRRKTGVFKF